MDATATKYLSKYGFSKIINDLAAQGVKSLEDVQKLSGEELVQKTNLKILEAKKLLDMLQNPSHPKSPRAASSKGKSGFGGEAAEDPAAIASPMMTMDASASSSVELSPAKRRGSQVQRDMDLRAWLESINPRYGKFAPAFEDQGVDLEEIDDGLPEDILSSVQSALSDHGAKETQLSKIMSQLRTRTGSTRGDQTGLSSPSPSPFSPFASAAAGTPASAVELPEDLMLDPSRIAIARDIGNGASATVHDATYELVNGREQAVVFKRFKPEMLEDPKDLNDIKNEVATMHKVDMSPFVLSLLGVNTDPRAIDKNGAKLGVGLMLEKASEGSAYEFLRTDPPPAWDVRMGLLLDSARGMLALHGHKTPLIHRDLKSLNILVCKVLQAGGKHQFIGKVADFGLARKITPITQKSAPLQTSLPRSLHALICLYICLSLRLPSLEQTPSPRPPRLVRKRKAQDPSRGCRPRCTMASILRRRMCGRSA